VLSQSHNSTLYVYVRIPAVPYSTLPNP
jgi:hypothetical protein